MKKQVETLNILLDSTIEGIVVFGEDRRAILVNKNFSKLFGFTEEEVIGMHALEFIAPESIGMVKEKMKVSDQAPYEARMVRRDGSKFWAILRGKNIVIDGKRVRVSAVIDISTLKEKEERILWLANHDYLTGTYNRRFFQEVLGMRIDAVQRSGQYGALLFIDLDDFKEINDALGHDVGDAVLIEMTRRLRECSRKSDIVARLGGDEFVVLLNLEAERLNEAALKAELTAEKILNAIKEPMHIQGNELRINASVGIAIIDEKATTTNLMKFADIAMYQAKKAGKNRIAFFDERLHRELEERIRTIAAIREAIREKAFSLVFQKQLGLGHEGIRTIGVEALIRWSHEGRMVPPDHFIPLAEESGLIVEIGHYVLREVAEILKTWQNDPIRREYRISVNISPRQFEESHFIERVEEVIHFYGIDPAKLRLEITENLLLHNIEESFERVLQLKDLGVTLSIDDFGTGFSSLLYLKKLPVDELKIDRSFIDHVENNESDRIIVETIASLGKRFGLEVIAEGVETEGQLKIVKEYGIDSVQGYLFSRPVPLHEL